MNNQTDPRSPFLWKGQPSIFTTGSRRAAQNFNGVNTTRAANQTRLEPRPLYLVSDSVYLSKPKLKGSK